MDENKILKAKTEIRNHIINFNNDIDFHKLQSLYFSKSFSEILSVSRREISHSSFLAWILKSNESHSLATLPLQKFLEIISIRYIDESENQFTKLFNLILTQNYVINSVIVEKEKSIDKSGRLDIFIKAMISTENNSVQTVNIIVENKVESKENNDQTDSYFDHFEKQKTNDEINLYVYLTPISTLELNRLKEPESKNKNFIHINYQLLVDYLFEPILTQNISERTKFIIKEYLQSLSQPALEGNEITNKQKQGFIMAIGKEEKDLLTNFWRKNEKLIMSAMYAISIDENQDEDVRETTGNALFALSSSDRDFSTINLYYDDIPYETDFRKADIGYFTVKLLFDKGLIDDDVFKFLREDKSCNFQLIRQKSEVSTETELKKYRVNSQAELVYNGESYFVARNWGKVNGLDNTEKLIEKITKKFPKISYKRNS
jgi:hypothetical protein